MSGSLEGPYLSRRTAMFGGALAAAWLPAGRVFAAPAETPVGFPTGVELYRSTFKNWSGEIRVDDLWTCAPRSADDVVASADWARSAGWRLRPRGMMHAWSPLVLGDGDARVVLLDTTQHLTGIAVAAGTKPSVRVQAGAQLTAVLSALKQHGLGLAGFPAIGEVTMAGVLAIGGHGAGLGSGTLSNEVLELSAVVWDPALRRYAVRRFVRGSAEIEPLLVNLGRIFVTEVVLRVVPDQKLRCISRMDISAADLYAAPARAGRNSFSALLDKADAVDAVWFPFTANPWVKTWSPVGSVRPLLSRPVSTPYNYPLTDQFPDQVSDLAAQLVSGTPEAAPLFGPAMYAAVLAGLTATLAWDITGSSMDVCLWTRATSLPCDDFGFVVLCRRSDVQSVLSRLHDKYVALRTKYRAAGEYPTNMPLHVRVTAADGAGTVVPGAAPPSLSPGAARPDHPEWNTAIWVNLLSLPGTSSSASFNTELQTWVLAELNGASSAVRFEWSKCWAYSEKGPWTSTAELDGFIPASFSAGRPASQRWSKVTSALAAHDPDGVFSTPFHERLLG